MYYDQLVGIGIITCNRKDNFRVLLDSVLKNTMVDCVSVVKNKEFDYGENDPASISDKKLQYSAVKDDLGIGFCKNQCIKSLMDRNCSFIFIIEDDVHIKDDSVFEKYIETAQSFNIHHLNWCGIPQVQNNPRYSLVGLNGVVLDIYFQLCGSFSFFTRKCIDIAGYIDDKKFINALEHVDHYYQISKAGLTVPFFSFPDIHDSFNYLEDISNGTTINRGTELYNRRLYDAYMNFEKKNGLPVNRIHRCSQKEIISWLISNISHKDAK